MAVYLNRTGDLTNLAAVDDVFNYTYTGTNPNITLPPGEYEIQCWGGKGGDGSSMNSTGVGARGGYSRGILTLESNDILHLAAGGNGANVSPFSHTNVSGGYNGGGSGQYHEFRTVLVMTRGGGGGGGGATHIAFSAGLLSDIPAAKRADVIIVAGGGGGGSAIGSTIGDGGLGGGKTGGNPTAGDSDEPASPGTRDSGGIGGLSHNGRAESGSYGRGGNGADVADYQNQCGGGGGWYGGGAGNHSGGGGGSGYVSNIWLTDASTTQESTSTNPDSSGNGCIRITVKSIYRYSFTAVAGEGITSASVSPNLGDTGDPITFTCNVMDGYVFRGWYKDDVAIARSQTYTYIAGSSDLTLEARAYPNQTVPVITDVKIEPKTLPINGQLLLTVTAESVPVTQ